MNYKPCGSGQGLREGLVFIYVVWFAALIIRRDVMKTVIIFLSLFMISGLSLADNLSDSNKLFHCAEQEYPEYFSPAGMETFTLQQYLVRYYDETDTYLGTEDEDVYVYGNIFGGLFYVGKLNELIQEICPAVEVPNLSGSWRIIGEIDARNCGEGIQATDNIATVTVDGSQVTVTFRGVTRAGVLDEDKIRYTVSYPDDGGTTQETGEITINNETSITGSQSWSWSNGQFGCSGTGTFSGTKL